MMAVYQKHLTRLFRESNPRKRLIDVLSRYVGTLTFGFFRQGLSVHDNDELIEEVFRIISAAKRTHGHDSVEMGLDARSRGDPFDTI
jgi:hypothetical protein